MTSHSDLKPESYFPSKRITSTFEGSRLLIVVPSEKKHACKRAIAWLLWFAVFAEGIVAIYKGDGVRLFFRARDQMSGSMNPVAIFIWLIYILGVGAVVSKITIIPVINKTFILLGQGQLCFHQAPIWNGRKKIIPTFEISDFRARVDERSVKRRRTTIVIQEHVVVVSLKHGEDVKICSVADRNEALYLANELEKSLQLDPMFIRTRSAKGIEKA